ncbi:hypothetical protein NC652_001029 [Populus alba x Populus x berolinensis]|nr:hypothetical protein NC652_001029 [Populus alba x Populus x berolinensis]
MASSAVLHRRVGLATIFLEISCFDLTPAKILELERAQFGLPIRMPSTSSKRTASPRLVVLFKAEMLDVAFLCLNPRVGMACGYRKEFLRCD